MPRVTIGHVLIAIAVAAPPMALVMGMARNTEGTGSASLALLIALACAFELELAFWLILGGRINRWLSPPAPPMPGEVRWLEEEERDREKTN